MAPLIAAQHCQHRSDLASARGAPPVSATTFVTGNYLNTGSEYDWVAAMNDRVAVADFLRRAVLPACCLLVVAYFVFRAISGPSGLLAWQGFKVERVAAEREAAAVRAEKAALAREIALLDPQHVDPDYADELVRRNLGVVRPDEVIVPLDPPGPESR